MKGNKGKVLQQGPGLLSACALSATEVPGAFQDWHILYCLILSKQYANAKAVKSPLDSQLLLHLTFTLKIKIRRSKSTHLYLKSGDTLLVPLTDG